MWEWPTSLRATGTGVKPTRQAKTTIKGRAIERENHSGTNYPSNMSPLHSRDRVTDPNGQAAREKRLAMQKSTADLYDEALQVYNVCKITPYHYTRTEQQRQAMTVVKTKKAWTQVKSTFEQQVRRDGFLSFDLEWYLPNHARVAQMLKEGKAVAWYEQRRLTYVVLGSLRGDVVILDMDSLHEAYRAYGGDDQSTSIPKEVLQWLKDGSILVAGSGITDDCEQLDIEANKMVDTAAVFRDAMTDQVKGSPLVDIGHCGRDGFGAQAFFAKTHDYKPMREEQYIERYGPHQHGIRWPDFRKKLILYKWRKKLGSLPEESLFYLYNDATLPAALVAALMLERLHRGVLNPSRPAVYGKVAEFILGPDFRSTTSTFVINLSAAEQEEIAPRKTPAKKPAAQGTSSATTTKRQATAATQTDDLPQVVGKVSKTVKGTAFAYYDNDIRRVNMYKEMPKLPNACYYCGSSSHSRHTKSGEILCPKYKADKGKQIVRCSYERCSRPTKHYTIMCSELHRICTQCQHRGHGPEAGCKHWGAREWRRALDEFERVAGRGLLTRTRHSDERFGFWSHVMGRSFPYPCSSYKSLVRRARATTVMQVDKKLRLRNDDGEFSFN